MKQEITAQVVVLPQDKRSNFGLFKDVEDDEIIFSETSIKDNPYLVPQHLYFTTDEPILHNDYILEQSEWGIKSVCRSIGNWNKGDYIKYPNDKKIVASTDPALGLPAIPTAWIRDVYVPSNGSIKEVKLELEFNHALKSMATESRIKLTPNNEVVIVDEPTIETFFPKEQCGDLSVDQELEDAADDYITGEEKQSFALTPILRVVKHAFKSGAEWQKEQSAKYAIEFVMWTHKNLWAPINDDGLWYNKNKVYQYKTECLTTKQLYELWHTNQKKSTMY